MKKYFRTRDIFRGVVFLTLLLSGCASRYTVTSSAYDAHPGEINQHVRLIQADPGTVYATLTDAAALDRLCPGGTRVAYLSPAPYDAGDLVETRVEHIFKLKWTSRVEAVEPNRMIRLAFQTGFFAGGAEIWQFEKAGAATRVSHTIIVDPQGVLKRSAWLLKVRRKHDKMVEQFLDNLKQVAENRLAMGSD